MTRALDRAFLAVVPPGAVLDALDARLVPVRQRETARSPAAEPGLRWARRAQWHVTLRFLGRVPDVDRLLVSVRNLVAPTATFDTELVGGGAFPRPERALVLWVGVDDGAGALAGVAETVEAAVVAVDFEPEPRPFAPHLTIARARSPYDVRPFVDAIGDGPIGPRWPVDEVVLLASDTRPEGAVFTEVGRVALDGAGGESRRP